MTLPDPLLLTAPTGAQWTVDGALFHSSHTVSLYLLPTGDTQGDDPLHAPVELIAALTADGLHPLPDFLDTKRRQAAADSLEGALRERDTVTAVIDLARLRLQDTARAHAGSSLPTQALSRLDLIRAAHLLADRDARTVAHGLIELDFTGTPEELLTAVNAAGAAVAGQDQP